MAKKSIGVDRVESLVVWLRDVCPKCKGERRVMGSVTIYRKPARIRAHQAGWTITIPSDAKVETISAEPDKKCPACSRKEFNEELKKGRAPKLRLTR